MTQDVDYRLTETDLGVSSNLPTYENLCEASNSQKRSFFVLRPTLAVTGWSIYSENVYSAEFSETYRNLLRDVVNVNVPTLAPLTRVESLALCLLTSNSYYFDPEEQFSHDPFTWGTSYWRTSSPSSNEGWWGQFTKLYINLGGTNPTNTAVIAELGFYMSQEGEIHPSMGPDIFADAGLMEAFTGSVPTGFSYYESDAGSQWASSQYTADYHEGASCAKIAATAAASGHGGYSKAVTLIAGKRYRLAGSYLVTDPAEGSDVRFDIRIGDGSTYLTADGRTLSASGRMRCLDTGGAWRRFVVDFIAPFTTTTIYMQLTHVSGTPSADLLLDKVTLRRVWRLDTYEARVGEGDIPPSTTGSPSIFFSGKSIGVGGFSFKNNDGAYDLAVGQLTWIGRKIDHYIGGYVPGAGFIDEDEWDHRFTGIVQKMIFEDEVVKFDLEDFRTKFHKTLPPNVISTTDTNVEPNARGKVKPLLFGGKNGIRPWRIGYETAFSLFGRYLVADCTDWASGLYGIDNVYAYLDEEAATQEDSSRRLSLNLPNVDREPDAITYGIASTASPSSYQTTYNKTASSSWTNNMILSKLLLHGDGYVMWSAGGVTNAECIVGFAADSARVVGVTDILGLWLNGAGTIQALEYGGATGPSHAYTGSYLFRVKRTSGVITYEYDSTGTGSSWTVLHTSTTVTTAPINAKASIYTTNKSLYAVSLYGFGEIATNLTAGTFDIRENVGPFEVTLANQFLNFDVGSTELTATVPVGLYTANTLAKELTRQLKSAAQGVSCSYSQSTGKFTVFAESGTLNLKVQDGKNKEASIWALIGFARSANKTGAITYTGDNSVWDVTSIDTRHIIRTNARGYKDDGSGTYTGTANSLIQLGTDIARMIIRVFLVQPTSVLNNATFVAARTTAPESLAIYLNEAVSSVEIFNRLEASNLANIIVSGDGKVHYLVYNYNNETVPASRQIQEKDFLEKPEFSRQFEEVYSAVTVKYDENPSTKVWKSETASNAIEAANYDAQIPKEVETYVRLKNTAELLAARMLVLAQRPPVRAHVVVGAKIFKAKVGDILSVYRRRAPTATGTSPNLPFRVLTISPDALEGRVTADLVEAQALPAGQNCLMSCQYLCQQTVQDECAYVAQTGCAVSSQAACSLTCQVCGQSASCQTCGQGANCQEACQLSGCQTCGQAGFCQSACQIASQGGGGGCTETCQNVCQACGQAANCQTCGQSSNCQDCGQSANCQSCGQSANCQDCGQGSNCQDCGQGSNCQTCGQASGTCQDCGQAAGPCQTTCQFSGCESNCQFVCQIGQILEI